MHKVVGGIGSAKEGHAAIVGDGLRDNIVLWSWAVVNPIDQDQGIHLVEVNRVHTVVANPDRVRGFLDIFDVAKRNTLRGEVCFDGVRIAANDIDLTFEAGMSDNLGDDTGVGLPSNGECLNFLPLGGCADGGGGGVVMFAWAWLYGLGIARS